MLLFLLASLALSSPPSPAALELERTEVAKEVLKVAGQIQREIEKGDAAALLARVPREGLRCGEETVPRARVERDLKAHGSWLHGVLFGGPGAPDLPGQPSSLRAFFAEAKEIAVVVAFREDPRSPLGLPCFEYRARDFNSPGAPLCLTTRDGKWWFTDSLYPC